MFTADEIQLMKTKCPSELEKFLNKLSIRNPDSNGKDDFSVYGKLDMKSDSVVQGYTKLLDSGNVSYSYSETDHELLNKIVKNKNQIIKGIEEFPKTHYEVEKNSVAEPVSRVQPVPAPAPRPSVRRVTKEEHTSLPGPIILGVVLIVIALAIIFVADSGIIGGIAALLGILSAVIGIKGKTVKVTVNVPVAPGANPVVTQTPVNQPVKKNPAPVRKEIKAPFTTEEVKKILDILTQADKTVQSI